MRNHPGVSISMDPWDRPCLRQEWRIMTARRIKDYYRVFVVVGDGGYHGRIRATELRTKYEPG
ncbi:MAG: hypothetical protein ACLTLQ_08720 [[Clostridium] scindens]